MLPPGTTMSCEEYRAYKYNKARRERYAALTPEEKELYREKKLAYMRRYLSDPEKVALRRETNRRYRQMEAVKEYQREYRAANREHFRAYQQEYRRRLHETAPEKLREDARRGNERGKANAAAWPDGVREDIREYRRRHMLSQQAMADRCGRSVNTIAKIETGWLPPSEAVLDVIGIRWRPGQFMGPYRRRYGGGIDKNSICNHCMIMDCDWMREHVPVDGWRARPDEQNYGAKTWLTWHVEACPLYREDASRELY